MLKQGPLTGVRVIELAGLAPVPFAGMMLADPGADVVRIDSSTRYSAPAGPLDRGKSCVDVNFEGARRTPASARAGSQSRCLR